MKRIAIIGAGISGLALANTLSQKADVVVFEKARGVGGRMSTRYANPFYFDHGVQFFTARTAEFRAFMRPYIDAGTVAQWRGKTINLEIGQRETPDRRAEVHWVANPNMNRLCKALAAHLDVRMSCEIAPLGEKEEQGWALCNKDGEKLGYFDWVISTAPPVQTLRLLDKNIQDTATLSAVSMQGCYTLMIGWNKPWDQPWIAARVRGNPIKLISVNSSKPGRDRKVTCLVAHSANDWAEAHIDDDMDDAQAFLLEQFTLVTGIEARGADYVAAHRWRYAIVEKSDKSGCYIDAALGLAATGDWCGTSRIEEAWSHAIKLSGCILQEI